MGKSASASKRVKAYPNSGLEARNGQLWCKYCNEEVDYSRKSVIDRHLTSSKHLKNQGSVQSALVNQPTLPDIAQNQSKWQTLIEAFVGAGVPIHVLSNPHIREWIQLHVKNGNTLPAKTALREFLTIAGRNDKQETIGLLKHKPIVIAVDETIDIKNRRVVNVLAKPLGAVQKFRLISSKVVQECNASEIAKQVDLALIDHFVEKEKLWALITDNTPYMILAGKKLKGLCERMMHSTCWAHILHLVSEELRAAMPSADKFISSMKAALVKAPSRRNFLLSTLKKHGFDEKLPPVPVLTRWTTWVSAADYYWQNFQAIVEFIQETPADSVAVQNLKGMTTDQEIAQQLESLSKICAGLKNSIEALECDKEQACAVWCNLKACEELLKCCGLQSKKLDAYLKNKHPAHKFWEEVQVFDPRRAKKYIEANSIPESIRQFCIKDIPLHEIVKYKVLLDASDLPSSSNEIPKFWKKHGEDLPELSLLALRCLSIPASSASVERSFSQLKRVFTSHRTRLTEENLEIHLKVMFNMSPVSDFDLSDTEIDDEFDE